MLKYLHYALMLVLFGCRQPDKPQLSAAQLEGIKKATYLPLKNADAYNFINRYYLTRLDTIFTKRKIQIHPLNLPDFTLPFRKKKIDTNNSIANVVLMPPPPLRLDTTRYWDAKKLGRVKLVTDAELAAINKYKPGDDRLYKAWRKQLGYGYMCISYPAYNAYAKRLVIREYLEDNSWCGTGRDHLLYYAKTATGWQVLNTANY